MRVLLIDDHEINALFLSSLLTLEGPRGEPPFEVVHESTLFSALQTIDRGPEFDAILLDLGLPECGGLTSLRLALAHAPWLPVLVVTGLDHPATKAEALRIGASGYLVKGQFGRDSLEQALRTAIEGRGPAAGVGQADIRGDFLQIQAARKPPG